MGSSERVKKKRKELEKPLDFSSLQVNIDVEIPRRSGKARDRLDISGFCIQISCTW